MIIKKLKQDLNKIGINIDNLLLPKNDIDMQRWSVVACDQYTSEPEYWNDADLFVNEKPSTLRMIFPEAFLESENNDQKSVRIKNINKAMDNYLANNLFEEITDSMILVERTFASNQTRHGLILAVDLDQYDFNKGSHSLIRATEGTIIDRLPPRIKIRENASLELPHIMILIDDREKTVIEPLVQKSESLSEVYSFELMKKSGSLKGWKISDEIDISNITNALSKLAEPDAFKERYHTNDDKDILLFAVGDGNHSLATAKACWENLKKTLSTGELIDHPAKYALVEVVNVHDSGLVFEPIHRVLFNVDKNHLIDSFCSYYDKAGCNPYAVVSDTENPEGTGHFIKYITSEDTGILGVKNPSFNLDVATLQNFLDDYLKSNQQVSIDYVHGEDVTERLAKKPGNIGFLLSTMDKNELFHSVILDGALPRKTFSMGEASEKRFYLESRKIKS